MYAIRSYYAVNVTYQITTKSPSGCEKTENLTVTIDPQPDFSYTLDKTVACVDDLITVTTSSSYTGVSYSLEYTGGAYGMQGLDDPTFDSNFDGTFSITAVAGIQSFRLTATSESGCSSFEDFSIKVFDTPEITISPSCYEQSITMAGTMHGTTSDPLNFSTADLGTIKYSYDDGLTWVDETYKGPGLPYGPYTVLARNSAKTECYTSVTGIMSLTSVISYNFV